MDDFERRRELRRQKREEMRLEAERLAYQRPDDDEEEAARERRRRARLERQRLQKDDDTEGHITEKSETNAQNSVSVDEIKTTTITNNEPIGDEEAALLDRLAKREERRKQRLQEALDRQKEFDPTATDDGASVPTRSRRDENEIEENESVGKEEAVITHTGRYEIEENETVSKSYQTNDWRQGEEEKEDKYDNQEEEPEDKPDTEIIEENQVEVTVELKDFDVQQGTVVLGVTIDADEKRVMEERARIEAEEKQAANEKARQEEEERRAAEERERREEEERRAAEERERREEGERRVAEERQRREEEERKAAKERREAEERMAAEARERREEEERKAAEERHRREEEERRAAEERQKREAEEKKAAKERERREAEEKRVAEERERKKAEEKKAEEKRAAEEKAKLEAKLKADKMKAEEKKKIEDKQGKEKKVQEEKLQPAFLRKQQIKDDKSNKENKDKASKDEGKPSWDRKKGFSETKAQNGETIHDLTPHKLKHTEIPSRTNLKKGHTEPVEVDGIPKVEAGKRLEELRKRRGETESEEFEKLKMKQQEAAVELEELKKKREERKKILEEEERKRKQEEADRKSKEEEEKRRLKEDIEKRRAEAAEKRQKIPEDGLPEEKKPFKCITPKASTLKIEERTEFLNKSAQKSGAKSSHPTAVVSKIDSRLSQYTSAIEGTKVSKPAKPAASDLPLPAEGVRNIKSMWEKGSVYSSPGGPATPNKETAGLKVGVSSRINDWLTKTPEGTKSPPPKPSDLKPVDVSNKRNLWEKQSTEKPGSPTKMTVGGKNKSETNGLRQFEKEP